MISIEQVLSIHKILIEGFGGAQGVRDTGILDSAISRPYQTFDGQLLYPSPVDRAAAIFESIISNHPFIDGNKRTAYVLLRLVLQENGLDISANEDDKYSFVIKAASSQLTYEGIREWITSHSVHLTVS